MMAHAQKPDFVLMGFKCDGTYAETRFRFNGFEVYAHKPDFPLLGLKYNGTCAESRFRLTGFEI
jgi:hypothetical protein